MAITSVAAVVSTIGWVPESADSPLCGLTDKLTTTLHSSHTCWSITMNKYQRRELVYIQANTRDDVDSCELYRKWCEGDIIKKPFEVRRWCVCLLLLMLGVFGVSIAFAIRVFMDNETKYDVSGTGSCTENRISVGKAMWKWTQFPSMPYLTSVTYSDLTSYIGRNAIVWNADTSSTARVKTVDEVNGIITIDIPTHGITGQCQFTLDSNPEPPGGQCWCYKPWEPGIISNWQPTTEPTCPTLFASSNAAVVSKGEEFYSTAEWHTAAYEYNTVYPCSTGKCCCPSGSNAGSCARYPSSPPSPPPPPPLPPPPPRPPPSPPPPRPPGGVDGYTQCFTLAQEIINGTKSKCKTFDQYTISVPPTPECCTCAYWCGRCNYEPDGSGLNSACAMGADIRGEPGVSPQCAETSETVSGTMSLGGSACNDIFEQYNSPCYNAQQIHSTRC